MKERDVYGEATALLGALTIALVVAWPLRVWVFVTCWAWFVVPIGGAPIAWPQGAGLLAILAMLRGVRTWTPKDSAEAEAFTSEARVSFFWRSAINSLTSPLTTLAAAWVFHTLGAP